MARSLEQQAFDKGLKPIYNRAEEDKLRAVASDGDNAVYRGKGKRRS